MRLLKRLPGDGAQLVSFDDDGPPPYAILSHTWVGEEVTYNDLVAGTGKSKAGRNKIRFCSDQTARDGLEYFWIDSCCIDQSNTQELSTAINSMFRWYRRASKCYVYLSDVSVPDEITNAEAFPIAWLEAFRLSRWFTRGWTLQELLAPTSVDFFCKQGKRLGSRLTLEQDIHRITRIPTSALRGQDLAGFTVEERMGWTAGRVTTVKEDKVYCLLGIFNVFLPLIYGEGESYAKTRLKDEIQRRQEGRGNQSLRNLSVFSSVPFPRNEIFVGRMKERHYLERLLLHSTTHRRLAIYGLGGCGKSALTIEFAYQALMTNARLVLWVPAINRESFELAYRDIGIRLRIPGVHDDNADVKRLVQETLSSENVDRWLMIVDNADDHEVLFGATTDDPKSSPLIDFLPHSDNGTVLFTTRSRKMAVTLAQTNVIELTDMTENEARSLLANLLTNQVLLDDEAAIHHLLEILARLPLAIVQAAAFMNNNDVSVANYISYFRDTGADSELFGETFSDPNRYKELDSTIAKTWHISFDHIRKQDSLAAAILSFIACIDRLNIPQSILPRGRSLVEQAKALGTLTGYAFIAEHRQTGQELQKDRYFDMHRLVHIASVWWLEKHQERAAWMNTALARLEEVVPYGVHGHKDGWTVYLPHAVQVAGSKGFAGTGASLSLLERVGWCQEDLGQHLAAEMTHRQVLSVRKERLGKEHPATLASMSNVARTLGEQGRHAEAEKLHRKVLASYKKVFGDEHPDTLTSRSNLALILSEQDKHAEAEEMQRDALALVKKRKGEHHPDVLMSMSNLAAVLVNQGKYADAAHEHRSTWELRRKVLGPEHPGALTSMRNLAQVLTQQGELAEAEGMHRDVLRSRQKVLGEEHPQTLESVHDLAFTLAQQHRFDEARYLYEQACTAFRAVLGESHPDTRDCCRGYREILALQEQELVPAVAEEKKQEKGDEEVEGDNDNGTGDKEVKDDLKTLNTKPSLDDLAAKWAYTSLW